MGPWERRWDGGLGTAGAVGRKQHLRCPRWGRSQPLVQTVSSHRRCKVGGWAWLTIWMLKVLGWGARQRKGD